MPESAGEIGGPLVVDEELAIITAKVTPHPLHFVQHLLPLEKANEICRWQMKSTIGGFVPSMTDLIAKLYSVKERIASPIQSE